MLIVDDRLLTAEEVGELFKVHRRVVALWARKGWLPHTKTPGGRYRFKESVVLPLRAQGAVTRAED